MTTTENNTQDPLFVHLVSTFTQSAWVSMGKIKNPVSEELERNLEQASFYIDLLDMMQTKMEGNLSEWETQFLAHSVSELKLNFIEEKNKKENSKDETDAPEPSEEMEDESGADAEEKAKDENPEKEEKPEK
ncbi:MAG: DUF1844 domain-containing protein [Candidatus Marinimicrobia bacterium]|jgi:hypothetical protein|nr:DUF1844 domain-containing protein [Candidatus Neomarinimicrobiota bacterium]MDP6789186.1 DUF1844 domain-containing protein [Candidatus Neomarinimicrobiota bacterium]MDP7072816.1 DUF1844 domain-containing protein [Candidatus Neomarinimicrobiota bacterium]